MKVQMPGHPIRVEQLEEEMAHVDLLDKLIQEHDAVYLLMDTREARWLPSVVAAAYNKVDSLFILDLHQCSSGI